jgi:hypothetical protein
MVVLTYELHQFELLIARMPKASIAAGLRDAGQLCSTARVARRSENV